MKRVLLLAGVAGALVGCGSGLPTPPALPNFNYGTPTSSLSSEQSNASSTAQSGIGNASGANGSAVTPTAAPVLADELAADLPSSALLKSAPSGEAALRSLAVPSSAQAASAFRSSGLSVGNNSCITQTDTKVTYSNCTYSGDGFSWTLNGSIAVAAGSLNWDIQATFSANSQGVTGQGQFHWYGQLSWTATTVQGSGRSELAVKADGQGQHVEIAATTGWNANLQIDSTNHCISGGSFEIARAVEGSASNGQHVSEAVGWKFTWNGCNSVQVSVGT
jgi:hypothetical protein